MSEDLIIKLKNIAAESPLSRIFFEILASRTNDANATKVDRMLDLLQERDINPARQEVVEIMKSLERSGVGRFMVGRHSKPSRFEWWSSALDVARTALGQITTLELSAPVRTDDSDSEDEDTAPSARTLDHRYHLRPDFGVLITLPVDISTREAARLAAFIQTLPIQPEANG